MAGPPNLQYVDIAAAGGEPRFLLADALAERVLNMDPHPQGGLISSRGLVPLTPNLGQGYPNIGPIHGLFVASSFGGAGYPTILLRAGATLYRFAGWNTTTPWEALTAGLSDDSRSSYPDVFVQHGDRIVWGNGINRPRSVTPDGAALPHGFTETPSPPSVSGPRDPGTGARHALYPNSVGYSWPGRIGSVGDVLDDQSGKMLAGEWYYYEQWEGPAGDLSAISPASHPLTVSEIVSLPMKTFPDSGTGAPIVDGGRSTAELDELLRSSVVRLSGGAPLHVMFRRVGRTMDAKRNVGVPRLHTTIPGRGEIILPDAKSDAELGSLLEPAAPMVVFRVAWRHGDEIMYANTPTNPGIVWRSMPGFVGTLRADGFTTPDPDGSAVTAGISHAGRNLCFTERSVFDMTEPAAPPQQLVKGVGCVAPRSLYPLPTGELIWLSFDGFYMMGQDGKIASASEDIRELLRRGLNRTRLRQAVAAYSHEHGQYRCAVPRTGSNRNDFILATAGDGRWSEYDYGIAIQDMASLSEEPRCLLIAGQVGATNLVMVADREVGTFTTPARVSQWRSHWLRMHEIGREVFHLRSVFLGLIDTYATATDAVVRFRRDWQTAVVGSVPFRPAGSPLGDTEEAATGRASRAPYTVGGVTLGTHRTRPGRVFWREIPAPPAEMQDLRAFQIEVEAAAPARFHLLALAFSVTSPSGGDTMYGRVPGPTEA